MSIHLAARPGWPFAWPVACALALAPAACMRPSIPARPLDPCAILAEVRHARKPPTTPELTLHGAAALMRRHNPKVRAARAAWRTAQALACTPTPLPNPTLELGPLLLGGIDVIDAAWGLEAALGWTVLLADTRTLTDHVNAVRAAAAFAEAAGVEREEYLALRRAYVGVQHAAHLREAGAALSQAARTSQETLERGVEAGSATVLDVQLLGLETAQIEAERLAAEEAEAEARGDLAEHLGLAVLGEGGPRPIELPALPSRWPMAAELEQLAVQHHPRLAVLRAEYLVREKELRLEVANAWPTLDIGLTYEKEHEDRLGLPLGVEIPLFDRNQPAIAEALAARRAVRERYAAALSEVLADVERSRARLELRTRRLDLYAAQRARAEETERLAEDVLRQTGTFDMLKYLEISRATRRALIEELASRAALYEAAFDLELACGAPLLRFASISGDVRPAATEPAPSGGG